MYILESLSVDLVGHHEYLFVAITVSNFIFHNQNYLYPYSSIFICVETMSLSSLFGLKKVVSCQTVYFVFILLCKSLQNLLTHDNLSASTFVG